MVFNFGSCYGLLASGNGRGHPGEGSIRTFKWLLRMECDAFRVCNAPRAFTRLIDLVLKDLHWQICLIYLDDVIVMGRTFGEELERWKQVFERLSRAGLKLKPMKTFVFQKQKWVLFLKHVVTGGSHRGRHRCRSCKGRAGLHGAHFGKQRGSQKLPWTCLLLPLIRAWFPNRSCTN